jgi:hypothetical protein
MYATHTPNTLQHVQKTQRNTQSNTRNTQTVAHRRMHMEYGVNCLQKICMYGSGRSLPLIFCIHVRSGPIYWGVIYLAKKL